MKIGLHFTVFIFMVVSAYAQNKMLIGQLSDRWVERESFNKNGDFLNKQTFKAGKLKEVDGYYEVEVVAELFDKDKKSTDKYTMTYRCKPDEAGIMVMAFPFSNPKSKETEISTTSENFKELYDLSNLDSVELEMSFDSGLLNFFGSNSKIKIYDRVLESNGNGKTIKSKINIKAYAIGIRIKQLDYVASEKLTNENLLSFQKFTEKDGSYFTMTYKP